MEMPIRIVIVLFVAVIVGTLIILFSRQLLDQAQGDLARIGVEDLQEDKILQLNQITGDEIIALANQCVRDLSGVFDETICYAVFVDSIAGPLPDGDALLQDFTLNMEATSASTALRFVYAPAEATVYVR